MESLSIFNNNNNRLLIYSAMHKSFVQYIRVLVKGIRSRFRPHVGDDCSWVVFD